MEEYDCDGLAFSSVWVVALVQSSALNPGRTAIDTANLALTEYYTVLIPERKNRKMLGYRLRERVKSIFDGCAARGNHDR